MNSGVDSNSHSNAGNCVFCGEAALLGCLRCGSYYCSQKCQQRDWPKHRNICVSKCRSVKMETPSNQSNSLQMPNFVGKNRSYHELHSLIEPHCNLMNTINYSQHNNSYEASAHANQDHTSKYPSMAALQFRKYNQKERESISTYRGKNKENRGEKDLNTSVKILGTAQKRKETLVMEPINKIHITQIIEDTKVNSAVDSNSHSNAGNCVFCGEVALLGCLRCSSYYCSQKCQQRDWPKHRNICVFKCRSVKMETPSNQPNSLQMPNFVGKNRSYCELHSLREPHCNVTNTINNSQHNNRNEASAHANQGHTSKDSSKTLLQFRKYNQKESKSKSTHRGKKKKNRGEKDLNTSMKILGTAQKKKVTPVMEPINKIHITQIIEDTKVNSAVDSNSHSNAGNCVFCGEVALLGCLRCSSYYCSQKCQQRDWPKHRNICVFKCRSVKMETPSNQPNSLQMPNFVGKNRSYCELHSLREPHCNVTNTINNSQHNNRNEASAHANQGHTSKDSSKTLLQFRKYNQKESKSKSTHRGKKKKNRGEKDLNTSMKILGTAQKKKVTPVMEPINKIHITQIIVDTKMNSGVDSNSHSNAGNCVFCGEAALLGCLRCGSYYCSQKCQKRDWPNHRKICVSKCRSVKMETPSNQSNSLQMPNFVGKNRSYHELHSLIEPHCNLMNTINYSQHNNSYEASAHANQDHTSKYPSMAALQFRKYNQKESKSKSTHRGKKKKNRGEKDLNTAMKILGTAQKKKGTPVMEPPFAFKLFDVKNDKFVAVIVDNSKVNSGYVSCIAEKDLRHFRAVHREIAKLHLSEEPYAPQLSEFCIAKFEGIWYRAKVRSVIDKTHFNVQFVDFKNCDTVTIDDIRPYPLDIKGDCVTNCCWIDGLPENISPELGKVLETKIQPQSIVVIDKVKRVGNLTIIECNALMDRIRKLLG